MSYWIISQMSLDSDLSSREAACFAQERFSRQDPVTWAVEHAMDLASEPGWAEAYESALAANVAHPGKDEGVITDTMILSGVQEVLARPDTQPVVNDAASG